jgi:ribosomal protein S18 acetylase RimI-like enzyme
VTDEGESARRALISDVGDIAALAAHYLDALESARGGHALVSRIRPLTEPDALAALITDSQTGALIVGCYGGATAGFALASSRGDVSGARRIEVEALYIDPPLRRVGVAEAVMDEVARYAREQHAASIDVVALPGDGATKSFLEATGFRARLIVMHRASPGG